ncbi:hypothetical protein ACH5RR_040602 [Cinchona calisaya]|uniref:Uncharacterized protein n=1 Tax=Cinchona calisaya TaxID=153742 RepID=A0ABD2XUS4_9GENT
MGDKAQQDVQDDIPKVELKELLSYLSLEDVQSKIHEDRPNQSQTMADDETFDGEPMRAEIIAGSTQPGTEEELQIVRNAIDQGVFYLLGEAEVVAKQDSSFLKKFIVNYAYSFIWKMSSKGRK